MNVRRCPCAECARLDLELPGEGMQLALPLGRPRRRRRERQPSADGVAA